MMSSMISMFAVLLPSLSGMTSAQALDQFTRYAGHAISGHDNAGLIVLAHEHLDGVDGCAQACVNDRGCNSFEYGVSGDVAGDCRLSYDTRATVAAEASLTVGKSFYHVSPQWDYYERRSPEDPMRAFMTPKNDSYLPGVDDVAAYTNVSVQGCAALCLHTPTCRSFEYAINGVECEDTVPSGIQVNGIQRPCPEVAALGLCAHPTYYYLIVPRCPLSCDSCPKPVSTCMLSRHVEGETTSAGTSVTLASKSGWTYIERIPKGPLCAAGSASPSGDNATRCSTCPANTYSSVSRTQCLSCPSGYVSNASSASVKDCARPPSATPRNTSQVFQEGELWVGNYYCRDAGDTTQGNGRMELLVTDVAANGTVTVVRKFFNTFGSASYYMTSTGPATLGESLNFTAGDAWLDGPGDNFTIQYGFALVSFFRIGTTGTVSFVNDSYVYTGSICDGFFMLHRTCEVSESSERTWEVGEQWIGDYQCEHEEDDRVDIRRLDLVIQESNGTHIRLENRFFHEDGSGAYNMSGTYLPSTQHVEYIPTQWIERPSTPWGMTSLDGAVTADRLIYTGMRGDDPACVCTGKSVSFTALDVFTFSQVTRSIGGTCGEYAPVLCPSPFDMLSTYCWAAASQPFCTTTPQCNDDDGFTLDFPEEGFPMTFVGCNRQACSSFNVHRVCKPTSYSPTSCACTGQTDSQGRGGVCTTYANDTRASWCYTSSSCLDAGPANASLGEGLYWTHCADVQDCVMSDWADWGPCAIGRCGDNSSHVVSGTRVRTRTVDVQAANGGVACGSTVQEESCSATCRDSTDPPSLVILTDAPTPAPGADTVYTAAPTPAPTTAPSAAPTPAPTTAPSADTVYSAAPTPAPTTAPTIVVILPPSANPTAAPSASGVITVSGSKSNGDDAASSTTTLIAGGAAAGVVILILIVLLVLAVSRRQQGSLEPVRDMAGFTNPMYGDGTEEGPSTIGLYSEVPAPPAYTTTEGSADDGYLNVFSRSDGVVVNETYSAFGTRTASFRKPGDVDLTGKTTAAGDHGTVDSYASIPPSYVTGPVESDDPLYDDINDTESTRSGVNFFMENFHK